MPGKDQHVSEEVMERFFRSQLSRKETAGVVRHLLAQCPRCVEIARRVGEREGLLSSGGEAERFGETAFLGLLEQGEEDILHVARERLRGVGLALELLQHPAEERLAAIRDDAELRSWGVFDRLLALCPDHARQDPRSGIELAQLALAVLATLRADEHGPELLADFRSAALGALANARRLAGFLEESRAAIQDAQEALEHGTGDPMAEAELLEIEARLYLDLGQPERAAGLLDRTIQIYREIGDEPRCAQALVLKANALGHLEPGQAVDLLHAALALLASARQPRLELCARHGLAWFLNDASRTREALALVELSRHLYESFPDAWTQLRLRWLEGRIARSLGDLRQAEAVLQSVVDRFEARGMHRDQTLAAIDLVEVYSLQGKFDAAVELVDNFGPALASWGMHSEGRAMWLLFHNAVVDHAEHQAPVEPDAFRGIASYFHRAWHQPMRYASSRPS